MNTRYEIRLDDFKRILFGDSPPEFLIEVAVRCILVYLVFILVVRWLGKRMAGQLSISEIAVMIMLGAIVSVPMQISNRGILMGLAALFIVVAYHRLITLYTFNSPRIETLLYGR